MTIREIKLELAPYKPCSVRTIYNYLHALKIQPVSEIRQKPQRYPADTPSRIIKALGLTKRAARKAAR